MNLIGVDVSLTGWYVLQVLERGGCQLFFFFSQATTILILVCITAINLQLLNLMKHALRISSSIAFIAG